MINLKKMIGSAQIWIIIAIMCAAAWFTHVVTCLSDERWGFLIAGALFFPIAIIHGIGIWFGIW